MLLHVYCRKEPSVIRAVGKPKPDWHLFFGKQKPSELLSFAESLFNANFIGSLCKKSDWFVGQVAIGLNTQVSKMIG